MVDTFKQSIYREHLQEISFLHEHRKAALGDPEFSLADLHELEERLEAHLDGLVIGADAAWALCQEQVDEGDPGEVHGAIRVCCRCDKAAAVVEIAKKVDWGDPATQEGFVDALKHDLPSAWKGNIGEWLPVGEGHLGAALAAAVGYKRLPLGSLLCEAARGAPPELVPQYLRALGQLREPAAITVFQEHLGAAAHEAGRLAAIGSLRLGGPRARAQIEQSAEAFSWTPIPLALGGSGSTGEVLPRLARKHGTPEAVIAVGLYGDPLGVETLLALLAKPECAEAAALALHLMTGAPLFEDAEVPAEATPSPGPEANEDTEDPAKKKEPDPRDRPDIVHRLAQAPELWGKWWRENQNQFRSGQRYRLGELRSATVALGCLTSTLLPLEVRQWVADELLIRDGIDLIYAPDMLVSVQRRALAAAQVAPSRAGQRNRPGA